MKFVVSGAFDEDRGEKVALVETMRRLTGCSFRSARLVIDTKGPWLVCGSREDALRAQRFLLGRHVRAEVASVASLTVLRGNFPRALTCESLS